jgi:outer membrane protein OmpA-like peptidoglycan-associated protein
MKLVQYSSLLLLCVSGCAGATPPREILDARSAYNTAASGPAGRLALADLHTAKETLQAAEQSYDRDGNTQDTRDLAYTAQRRAELATARADVVQSLRQRDAVIAQMNANQTAQVQLTSAALGRANQQLNSATQALSAERARAADAERRAAQAASDLARIATVKQEARGLVITLSGSILFASGKSEILPAAQSKLSDVANALMKQDPSAKIVVEGFTDSTGGDALNQALSESRAEAVRSFLVSHGVSSDRISAEGRGPSDPIADNASPEGRANNRRVEIVIQSAPVSR